VPDANVAGADSFDFRATDCSGDRLRSSAAGTVSVDVRARNDAPFVASVASSPPPELTVGASPTEYTLNVGDADAGDTLTTVLVSASPCLTILAPDGTAISSMPYTLPTNATGGTAIRISADATGIDGCTSAHPDIEGALLQAGVVQGVRTTVQQRKEQAQQLNAPFALGAIQVRAVDASGANTTGTVYFTVLGEARSSSSNNKAAAVAAIVAASVVVLGVLICLVLARMHYSRKRVSTVVKAVEVGGTTSSTEADKL